MRPIFCAERDSFPKNFFSTSKHLRFVQLLFFLHNRRLCYFWHIILLRIAISFHLKNKISFRAQSRVPLVNIELESYPLIIYVQSIPFYEKFPVLQMVF